MTTPDTIERDTLRGTASRLDDLRMRSALTAPDDGAVPICAAESLESLALSEVLIRKALHGRQLDVRTARNAGASWTQIGAALEMSKHAAWEAHDRWVDGQAALHRDASHEGLDPSEVARARTVAGGPGD